MDDHALAASLAQRAGALLVKLREDGPTGAQLGAAADKAANAFLLTALRQARPGDAILSEEGPADPARLDAERVWIVDPLDGTREYVEGRSDWAVHVALSVAGIPIAGAVDQPARARSAATVQPPRPQPRNDPLVVTVSRSRPPARAADLARRLDARLLAMGSAGAKTLAVIQGEADLYFHEGGQHEWDNCAPVAVALAAGLAACRCDGSPLRYNQPDVRVPDLLIGTPALVARAVDLLRV